MSAQKIIFELLFSLQVKDAGEILSIDEDVCGHLLADVIASREFVNLLKVMRGEEYADPLDVIEHYHGQHLLNHEIEREIK